MNRRINPEIIQNEFHKAKENNIYLESLYNSIQFIITNVTNNKAKRFRRKYPQDFEDLQQVIRLDIWRVFERLLGLSYTADQFIRILISAISFSFRSNYKRLKKTLPVSVGGTYVAFDWAPDEDVPIELTLEEVFDVADQSANEIRLQSLLTLPSEYVNSSIDLALDISTLTDDIFKKALKLNRFNAEPELTIIEFCLSSYLRGREPSKILISSFFDSPNISWFFIDYAKILIKIAIIQHMRELKI